jgi:prolyl 4-hydroxylase
VFCCSLSTVRSEVFTALADLEDLLETESLLISTLEHYIKAEEEKLNYLKRLVLQSDY